MDVFSVDAAYVYVLPPIDAVLPMPAPEPGIFNMLDEVGVPSV
jgi:hypothetical protein